MNVRTDVLRAERESPNGTVRHVLSEARRGPRVNAFQPRARAAGVIVHAATKLTPIDLRIQTEMDADTERRLRSDAHDHGDRWTYFSPFVTQPDRQAHLPVGKPGGNVDEATELDRGVGPREVEPSIGLENARVVPAATAWLAGSVEKPAAKIVERIDHCRTIAEVGRIYRRHAANSGRQAIAHFRAAVPKWPRNQHLQVWWTIFSEGDAADRHARRSWPPLDDDVEACAGRSLKNWDTVRCRAAWFHGRVVSSGNANKGHDRAATRSGCWRVGASGCAAWRGGDRTGWGR